MMDDQQAVTDFLSDPSSYGPAVERVDIIETHVSLVFLAGDRAYKLKRAVAYPYLDFSTPQHRRRACEAELALNRRTAPTLYLEVRALGRLPDGKIGFASNGPAVDWVVVMRRFEQSSLFDAVAQTGGLSPRLINELAGHIADFHVMAERRFDYGGATAMTDIAETNHRSSWQLATSALLRNASMKSARVRCNGSRPLAGYSTDGAQKEKYGVAMGICTSAISVSWTASRPYSIASNSRTPSPLSMFFMILPSC
jgi:aminoglycoside phosphotransferase family enzyme